MLRELVRPEERFVGVGSGRLSVGRLGHGSDRLLGELGVEQAADLGIIDEKEARVELAESKQTLEDRLGRPVRFLAYPYGGRNNFRPEYQALAQSLGYEGILSCFGGFIDRPMRGKILPREAMPYFRSLTQLEVHLSGSANWYSDVFIKDLATGAISQVSPDSNSIQVTAESGDPVFSPDGTTLAAAGDQSHRGVVQFLSAEHQAVPGTSTVLVHPTQDVAEYECLRAGKSGRHIDIHRSISLDSDGNSDDSLTIGEGNQAHCHTEVIVGNDASGNLTVRDDSTMRVTPPTVPLGSR